MVNLHGVATSFTGLRVAPVVIATLALGARKADILEHVSRVELLRVSLELGPRQSFDFLSATRRYE